MTCYSTKLSVELEDKNVVYLYSASDDVVKCVGKSKVDIRNRIKKRIALGTGRKLDFRLLFHIRRKSRFLPYPTLVGIVRTDWTRMD